MDQFLIKKHSITEKAASLNADRKYVFIVRPDATKSEIKKAVRAIYKVDASAVNIVNLPLKRKRVRGVMRGGQQSRKKAIVTLKEGQKINIQ